MVTESYHPPMEGEVTKLNYPMMGGGGVIKSHIILRHIFSEMRKYPIFLQCKQRITYSINILWCTTFSLISLLFFSYRYSTFVLIKQPVCL